MAKTKYSLYDNEQLGFFKADERTSSALGYIKNQAGKLEIKAEATNSILLKSDLELTSGASIKSSSGIINIGASGDTINLNIGGVTYNVGNMTGSPVISGNITVNGSGTNSFYGTSNFYGTLNLFGATMNIEATTITVDDKNIELGAVASPTDTTADGGGIILKGATDKTILWANSTDTWNFNQGITAVGTITATLFSGSGASLTNLNASNLSSGTVPDARITGAYTGITTLSMSGQLTNTLASGTAPFVITSPTLVTNLNSDLWDGYHFADYLNQAVKTTSSPTFASITLSNLSTGYIPYKSSTTLVNSPIYTDGTNIGIGTTSPIYGTDIVKAGVTTQLRVSSGVGGSNYTGGIRLGAYDSTQTADILFTAAGQNSLTIATNYVSSANAIYLKPGTATALTALGSGNVGIGTTTPGAKLEVSGGVNVGTPWTNAVTGEVRTSGKIGVGVASGNDVMTFRDTTNNTSFNLNINGGGLLWRDNSNNALVVFTQSGNVGIGTTNPGKKFDVSDSSNSEIIGRFIGGITSGSSVYSSVEFGSAGDTNGKAGHIGYLTNNSNLNASGIYLTNYGESELTSLFIKRGGNVGIGTTAPLAKLQIEDTAAISLDTTSASNGNLIIKSNTGGRTTTSGAQLEFVIPANTDGSNPYGQGRIITVAGNSLSANATGKMILGTRRYINKIGSGSAWYYGDDLTIDGSGNVGIGTTNPGAKLTINSSLLNSYPFAIYNSLGNKSLELYEDAQGDGWLRNYDSAGTEKNRIRPDGDNYITGGNVGIGTTNPTAKLDVAGDIYVNNQIVSGKGYYGITGNALHVSQTSHGFVVGEVLYRNGTVYAKAIATSKVTAEVVGIVIEVIDSNNFKMAIGGIITTGVPALAAGTVLFLSASTAGFLTDAEPITNGQISKPVAIILEAGVSMSFVNMRGLEWSEDDSTGELFDLININTDYTATYLDNMILGDTTNNNITVTLPTAVDSQGKIFYIKKTDSSRNKIYIQTTSNELIDGELNIELETHGEYVQIISNNTNWSIIGD